VHRGSTQLTLLKPATARVKMGKGTGGITMVRGWNGYRMGPGNPAGLSYFFGLSSQHGEQCLDHKKLGREGGMTWPQTCLLTEAGGHARKEEVASGEKIPPPGRGGDQGQARSPLESTRPFKVEREAGKKRQVWAKTMGQAVVTRRLL